MNKRNPIILAVWNSIVREKQDGREKRETIKKISVLLTPKRIHVGGARGCRRIL